MREQLVVVRATDDPAGLGREFTVLQNLGGTRLEKDDVVRASVRFNF